MEKKIKRLIALFAACALALVLFGCKHSSGGGDDYGSTVPEGFVSVPGGTVVGAKNENNYAGVFVENRKVTLGSFWMSKYPVTKAQYRAIMSSSLNTAGITADPSYSTNKPKTYVIAAGENDDKRPIEGVSWYDAVYFCNLLSKKEGLQEVYTISNIQTKEAEIKNAGADGTQTVKVTHISSADVTMDMTKNGYRLPTEAEWEYAARGGNPSKADWNYTFSGAPTANGVAYNASQNSGMDAVGWYSYNTCNGGKTSETKPTSGTPGYGTHEVGKKKPNALGLYDMSGNVWEWCWDWYGNIETTTDPKGASSGSNRVYRGGSWVINAYRASVCCRLSSSPSLRYGNLGFRVVRSSSN